MKDYLIAEKDTGRIIQVGQTNMALDGFNPDPESLVLVEDAANIQTDYVLDGAVTPRPALGIQISKTSALADDTDEITVSGLPAPVTVRIDGEPYEIADGSLTLTSPTAHTFELRIEHWPYQAITQTLTFEETA